MSPKEKALKLVDAFYQLFPPQRYVAKTDGDIVLDYDTWDRAKMAALVSVNQMLDNAGYIWGGAKDGRTSRDLYREFWTKVKEEIQNL